MWEAHWIIQTTRREPLALAPSPVQLGLCAAALGTQIPRLLVESCPFVLQIRKGKMGQWFGLIYTHVTPDRLKSQVGG